MNEYLAWFTLACFVVAVMYDDIVSKGGKE